MLDGIFQIVRIILSQIEEAFEEKVVQSALDSFQVPFVTGSAVV